ncbi:MAG: GNAT family N-acetyltransferase [Verrucomicrobiota bacterium]
MPAPAPVRLAFRRATTVEAGQLQELAGRIWRACYPGLIPAAQIEYMLTRMYAPERIAEEMRRGVHWEWAVLEDTPAGYLAWEREPGGTVLQLHKLYLAPAHHGRGLGQQMLQHVFEHARSLGVPEVELGVNKRNDRALRAYRRAGFKIVKSVCREIGGGWVMDDFLLRARPHHVPPAPPRGRGPGSEGGTAAGPSPAT